MQLKMDGKMEVLANEIGGFLGNSSWIRRMFEAGIELKKQYGADNVYDFSIGNPDLPPPMSVKETMTKISEKIDQPFALGYMPNAGYPEVRAKLAAHLSAEQGVQLLDKHVVMSCGAAGGINAFFRAVLNPGEEVVVPAPYFVEYGFYVGNFGGKLVPVKAKDFTFELDLAAIESAINEKTRAVIINSPNNPTGQIYSASDIAMLSEILTVATKKYGHPIYLIADEPYRFLNFDQVEIPSVLAYYEFSVVIGSYSKSLSLAGERIGYIAINPAMRDGDKLIAGLIMTTRILGFVNAPALAQQILLGCLESSVDLNIYGERRDAMAKVLDYAGLEYTLPRGAFYFFPKSPLADDMKFIDALVEERVLAVTGRGFGCPGYVRMAFCVDMNIINRSAESMKRAVDKVKNC